MTSSPSSTSSSSSVISQLSGILSSTSRAISRNLGVTNSNRTSLVDGKLEEAVAADSLVAEVIEDSLGASMMDAQDDEEFNVSIHRTSRSSTDGRLGLRMSSHESGSHLIINSVSSGGSVSEWNKNCPELALKEGDKIVGVNGVRGNSGRMLRECTSGNDSLRLTVRRSRSSTC